VTLALVPFALDQGTSLRFASEALRQRLVPGESFEELFEPLESSIRSAHATGGLVRSAGATVGLVLWEPSGPLGVSLRLLYLASPDANAQRYGELVDLVRQVAGPIAFAPGSLSGLSADEESSVMTTRGFATYGRSEMKFGTLTPVPELIVPLDASVRDVRPEDEPALARLHEAAYLDHLDRYLSLEEWDPVRDADRQLRAFFGGRYGEILSPGSSVTSVAGRPVAAVLSVERPGPALIIDVMVEPGRQGRGYARAALVHALRSLRNRGLAPVILNVTEGNDRAIRLYESVGFARSIGPSVEWYHAARMPVRVPETYSRSADDPGIGSATR